MNGAGHEMGNNAYWPYLHHGSVAAQSPQNANQSDAKCKAAVSTTANKKHPMYRYIARNQLSAAYHLISLSHRGDRHHFCSLTEQRPAHRYYTERRSF